MPVDVVKRRRSRGIDVDAAAIREARLAAGLSLAELAMGSVSRQAMHLIESGRSRPSPRVLHHIAAKTGRSASDFYATARRAGRSSRQRAQHSAPVVELERLIAIRAFTEATERGRELLDELEGTPDEPSIRLLLGEALVMTRQPDQGLMHLRLARAAFDDGLDQWGSIAATDLEGMALYLLDDPTCLTVLEDALRRARLLDPAVDSMQVKILTHIATVHVSRHAWYEALRYYEEATKSSDNVRDLAQRARTYDGLSQAYARLGQTARAIGYANRALALYATQTDLAGVYRAENNLGDLLLQIGEVDAAEPHLRRAFDGCQSMGLDRRGSGYVLVNLAELAFRRGRVSE